MYDFVIVWYGGFVRFSPGLLAAGVFCFVVCLHTDRFDYWWGWIAALAIWSIVDGLLGWHRYRVLRLPTSDRYEKK